MATPHRGILGSAFLADAGLGLPGPVGEGLMAQLADGLQEVFLDLIGGLERTFMGVGDGEDVLDASAQFGLCVEFAQQPQIRFGEVLLPEFLRSHPNGV
ncbi:MAG: hypothetical protein H7A45_15940 [Verrucomicrobiales bacterium]|nr:hypothetical protein [Verrucomicrobiales bacterium]